VIALLLLVALGVTHQASNVITLSDSGWSCPLSGYGAEPLVIILPVASGHNKVKLQSMFILNGLCYPFNIKSKMRQPWLYSTYASEYEYTSILGLSTLNTEVDISGAALCPQGCCQNGQNINNYRDSAEFDHHSIQYNNSRTINLPVPTATSAQCFAAFQGLCVRISSSAAKAFLSQCGKSLSIDVSSNNPFCCQGKAATGDVYAAAGTS